MGKKIKRVSGLKFAALIILVSLLINGFFPAGSSLASALLQSPCEVLVGFKTSLAEYEEENFCQKYDLTKTGEIKALNVIKANASDNSILEEIKNDSRVKFIEVNQSFKACLTPNDPYFALQWSLNKIGLPEAWEAEKGTSNSVTVAVLDTGVYAAHPDLAGKVVAGYDFVNLDTDPSDDDGHGTAVASIVAAVTNNAKGIAGISWGAKIMPIKVLNGSGYSSGYAVSKGIIYAADGGAKVINMSFGGSDYSTTIDVAISYAKTKGCLLAAAAGNLFNGALPGISYPAAYDGVLAVSATNESDLIASWSNYGDFVDLAAPGNNILAAYPPVFAFNPSDPYVYVYGTSAAAPHVSGLAALLWSKYPYLTATQVEDALIRWADDLGASGFDVEYGWGRVNGANLFKVERVYGNTRYGTSVALSKRGWTNSYYAVIASGENFPDALAGSSLAGKYNCPLLLTPQRLLPSEALNEILRLGVSQVFVLGGTGAVSQNVVSSLKSRGISVTRIYGQDRYETAVAIARKVGSAGTAIVATGENFPDALAASSLSFTQKIPILLVKKDSVPSSVSQALVDLGVSKTIVLGGPTVISNEVESQLPSPTRIYGIDRYETSALLANYAYSNYGLLWNSLLIATGSNFPDALSGGSLAGKNRAVLLLTSPSSLSSPTYASLSANRFSVLKSFISGGPGAISENTKVEIDYTIIGK